MPGQISARPAARLRFPIRSIGGTPAFRSVAAAVIAVAALITAGAAGPAGTADDSTGSQAPTAQHVVDR
ncbi:hypothetical protein ABZ619_04210 [Streptomyces sp. NPDC007851]|uniref:hypothetical protein n=1 Tax=Streptomyces sp. NPDC007851 TaxID=3155008 RepID=UPI0033D1333C